MAQTLSLWPTFARFLDRLASCQKMAAATIAVASTATPTLEWFQVPGTPANAARLATVIRWAHGCGIRFLYNGSGGIWTTMDALNEALGLAGTTPHLEPYDPNDF